MNAILVLNGTEISLHDLKVRCETKQGVAVKDFEVERTEKKSEAVTLVFVSSDRKEFLSAYPGRDTPCLLVIEAGDEVSRWQKKVILSSVDGKGAEE